MAGNKKILGIVPARGGSKGLPGKNTRMLCDKPLIAWTIEAGLKSNCIDELVVTTDSSEIADVAKQYGAKLPFLRPVELATDDATSIDVVIHTVEWYKEDNKEFDYILLLQPTSPLRSSEDILLALDLLWEKNANAVISVCETDHHPWWSNTLPPNGNMSEFLRPEITDTNRQALPEFYRLNGAIYLVDCQMLLQERSFWQERTYAYIMPKERSIDIDDMLDFKMAEYLLGS